MKDLHGYTKADAERELHEYMTDGKGHTFKIEEAANGDLQIWTPEDELLCVCEDAISTMLIIKNMRIARNAIREKMQAAAMAAIASALHQKFGGDKAKMDEEVAKHPEIKPFTQDQVDFLMGLVQKPPKNED